MSTLGIPADYGVKRGMAPLRETTGLVTVGTSAGGRPVLLDPVAAEAWGRMRDAAFRSGVTLVALSGFRSIERQEAIIQRRLSKGEGLEEILKTVAAPGYSEHHTGRAVDIAVPEAPTLTDAFAQTEAYRWLCTNAPGYGFHLSYPPGNAQGFSFEPWHWCFKA